MITFFGLRTVVMGCGFERCTFRGLRRTPSSLCWTFLLTVAFDAFKHYRLPPRFLLRLGFTGSIHCVLPFTNTGSTVTVVCSYLYGAPRTCVSPHIPVYLTTVPAPYRGLLHFNSYRSGHLLPTGLPRYYYV